MAGAALCDGASTDPYPGGVVRSARRSRGLLAPVLLVALALAAQATAAAPGKALAFREPVVVIPPEPKTTEPQVVLTDKGTVLVAAQYQAGDCENGLPHGVGSRVCAWRSDDGGSTFRRSGGGQNTGADAYFARMPSGTLLYTGLAQPEPGTGTSGVGGAVVLRSTDDGRTWSSMIMEGLSPALDRPYLLPIGGRTVLLTYTAWPGNLFVSRSDDDGATFGPGIPITVVPEQLEFTRPGGPALDHARGAVLQPYFAGTQDDPAINQSSQSGLLDIKLARSSDGGATWTTEMIAPRIRPILGMPNIAADGQGGEYMVWSARDEAGQVGAYLSRNLKPGSAWSAPVRLGDPGHSGTLAWVVARGKGGVAVGYLGSDFADARTVAHPWDVRVAVSRDSGTSWTTTSASGHAVYDGPQNGALSLTYDLFGITLDDEGFLHLVYPRRVTQDGTALNQIEYTRQVAGSPLGGRPR
jgi:hypothetical protein